MTPAWTRRIADEFWSGPVTPLTYSMLAETMAEHMVRRVLRQAGLGALATQPVLLRSRSHVYVNGTLLAEIVSLLPPLLRSDGLMHLLPDEVRSRIVPTSVLAATARTVEMAARFAVQEPAWSPWQRAGAFESTCTAVRARFTTAAPPAPSASLDELMRALRATRGELGAYLESVSWGVVYAYVFYHLLHELCRRWAPGHATDHAALTVGLPRVASFEAAEEIAELGALLARDPATMAALRARPGDGATIVTGAAAVALQGILTRHGHRLVGRDLACASWREAPGIVLGLALRSTERQAHEADDAIRRRVDATARVEAVIAAGSGGALRLRIFRVALDAAQRYYVVRENMRYYADFFLARMRELALAAGARLVAERRLVSIADVFLLAFDELAATSAAASRPTPQQSDAALLAHVVDRRRELARDSATPPPATLDATAKPDVSAVGATPDAAFPTPGTPPADSTSSGTPPADATTAGAARTLRGECAAPGHCLGRARVVRDTDDFPSFERGDIMVAGYTDPGWTPVLELASGLVLDAGGQLSHGAIVARELGIPALVNVQDATRAIRDGDALDLDATAGLVRVTRGA